MTEEKFKEVIRVAKKELEEKDSWGANYCGVCYALEFSLGEIIEENLFVKNILMKYLDKNRSQSIYWMGEDPDKDQLPIRETMLELLELFVISENLYEEL